MPKTEHDLPLFNWSPPECVVIAFPLTKRTGKIRRTAEILSGKSGKGADAYWHQVTNILRDQLERAGLDDDVIDAELREFAKAVFARIGSHPLNNQKPGSAV